ncbi:hypothetical protein [Psychrobacter sp. FDAARGOS_221]|uniref:hypothetical protein n=1 Tax=Psychrobacter sp. FDAARGOS_221 TaxID=1975705 RepID=UPI000BB57B65|nr:hypothetical protein [Psychrobacter sp. FDAARGOS_221]PNK60902.1 hypothetical protein A6J60_008435 [Psychrobacter sp. FDAARGOS_221]
MNDIVNNLLTQLQQQPDNDQLLASLALYYMQHPAEGDKDLEYLKKAYQANPSIENTHNLAFWSFFEYGADDSLKLQQQVLQLAPHSYYPYAAYAQMLISNEVTFEDIQPIYHYQAEDYQAIIAVSHTALEKLERLNQSQSQADGSEFIFYNNIAYAYAKLGNYLQAFTYFDKSENHIKALINTGNSQYVEPVLNEHLYSVLLNKIRLHILMGDKQQALNLLKDAQDNDESCALDMASLYAQIGEYDRASDLVQTEEVHESWGWIWYAIYNSDKQKWRERIGINIEEQQADLLEYQNDMKALDEHPNSHDYNAKLMECQQDIEYRQVELEMLQSLLANDRQPKPQDNILNDLRAMYIGCLLFGCQCHNNLLKDA